MRDKRGAVFIHDLQYKLGVLKRDFQTIGTGVMPGNAEAILFEQIVDRDLTFMLFVRGASADRGLVKRHRD